MNDASAREETDIGSGPRDAVALATEALRACLAGRIAEGAALYRQALRATDGCLLPVGRHVQLLAGSGLPDAAALVERAGWQAGADLSTGRLARGGDPHEAVAEYEAFFARGRANARMMANYLVGLSRIGAAAKLAAASDPRVLFRQTALPVDGPIGEFLGRVANALLGAENGRFRTSDRSLRNMARVPATHKCDHPDIVTLHGSVGHLIGAYIADVRASGHPIASWLSSDFHLDSWAVISDGLGHSAPHIHTGCWVVAVAYIAAADQGAADGGAGSMRIGPPPDGNAACAGWPDLTVAPTPGTVAIMPAYYTHWTIPLRAPGVRISVAFNAADTAHRRRPPSGP
jgi:hypothetical protein